MFKSSSKQLCWHAILHLLRQRGHFLLCQEDDYLIRQILCAYSFCPVTEFSRASIVCELLDVKYGKDIVDELSHPLLSHKQAISAHVKSGRMDKKMQERMTSFQLITNIQSSWPHKISCEIIFK